MPGESVTWCEESYGLGGPAKKSKEERERKGLVWLERQENTRIPEGVWKMER